MLTLTTLSELRMEKWLATAINELAADQSLDVENAKVAYQTYGSGQVVSFGDAEYAIYKDYDEAEAAAVEYVRESLEEDPEGFNQDWLQYYYYMREGDKKAWADELADWAYDLDDEDALERAGMGEDEDADEHVDAERCARASLRAPQSSGLGGSYHPLKIYGFLVRSTKNSWFLVKSTKNN